MARGWAEVEALALADVDVRVSVYGVEIGFEDEGEVEGMVNRMFADSEAGKSFRRTFVSSRWCVGLD